jgi:biopolymer transport protein ExbD
MRRRPFTQINVVPFIDIVLVLLVIVLATATFIVKNELPVELPKSGSQAKIPPKSVSISIDAKGRYFFQKSPVSLEGLRRRLRRLDPVKDLITLNADQKSQFQKFVTVVDLLKRQGFKKISIITAP